MSTPETILVDRNGRGICTVTLNRPERRNALDVRLIQTLIACLRELATDDKVRVVVLSAAGETFSSGADLDWMHTQMTASQDTNRQNAELLSELMHHLNTLCKPTIARINGNAYGGGIGLVACCDIAIADQQSAFAFTEARLGIAPVVIAPYVIDSIGARQARRYFLTGETIGSADALRIGLIHQAVNAERLDAVVADQIDRLLKAGPQALQECKRLTTQDMPRTKSEAVDRLTRLCHSREAQEGISAFLEKRKPDWCR